MRRGRFGLLLATLATTLLALGPATPARGEQRGEEEEPSGRFGYSPRVKMLPPAPGLNWNLASGHYRFVMHRVGSYLIDAEGTQSPMGSWAEHRLRYSPAFTWSFVGLKADLDILSGQLFGDHEDLYPEGRRFDRHLGNPGAGGDGLLLRQAYLQLAAPFGLLRVGQMTSSYGLGILANSGEDDDLRVGTRRHGDIVDRALLLVKPFRPLTGPGKWGDWLALMVAGDMVYQDENARYVDGDRAYMGTGGLLFRHPRFTNAFILTFRTQEDEDGDTLEVFAFNVNGQNRIRLAETSPPDAGRGGIDLFLDYEAAWLLGHTDRVRKLGSEDGLDLRSFGAVGRVGVDLADLGLEVELEVGYASGDNNSYDDESHAFYFDPDYNVGMIFFDEMLPLITARAAELSSDPANLDVPPKGVDMIPSQGRVTNTIYYLPQVRYALRGDWPVFKKLQVLAGGLVLTTPADFGHSYYSFKNGGTAANHLGRPTDSSYLGTELLAGLRLHLWPWTEHIGLVLHVDQSYFLPGGALADPDGGTPDPVWKLVSTASLHWQ